MNEFQNIQNDIKNKRFIESYIVLAMGIAVLTADIIGITSVAVMNEIILAILSTLIYLTILERREIQKASDQLDIEGISTFRANRNILIPLDVILNQAKKEIILYAVQHSTIVHQYLGLLEEKAEAGCQVKILMMAATHSDGSINPNVAESESHRRYSGLLQQIVSSTNSFSSWLASLSPPVQTRVEIRKYQECPIATYLFVDRDEVEGFVQVELLLFGIHVHDMPHYIVTKKDGGRFFDIHCESFDKLWEKSQVLEPDSQLNLSNNAKTESLI
jgi:hypothetical protein